LIRLEPEEPRWRAFVESRPEALPYHHPAWAGLLAETYGYRPFALALQDPAGALVAGLPFLETRSVLRSRRWVALPFTDSCPVLGDAATHESFARELALERERAGVTRVEVHASLDERHAHLQTRAVVHTLALSDDPGAVFRTFKKSQVQQPIAKAERDGVVVRRAEVAEDLTKVFYGLHLQTRRRHGAPVQPRRFFDLLWRRIVEPGLGFVLVAEAASQPIAAAVFLAWGRTVLYKYSASSPEHWKLRPNNLVIWTAIRDACQGGRSSFDFGKSELDNEGLRAFKRGWGTREEPLPYATIAAAPPRAGADGMATRALEGAIRRSPAWVCRAAGELLYKYAA
jgi:CelD/BcsL family acetyltransferase involved in cellulose biosynthesis